MYSRWGRVGFLLTFGLLILAACATPAQKAQVTSEQALAPSEDRFWRHIDEASRSDWFRLLNRGDDALAWRLAMIDSAHQSIDMETFLWKPDEGGMKILLHLLAAADRGVRVRILLDDSFTPHEDLALHDIDNHPNIALRIYNPYNHRPESMVGRTIFNLGDFKRVNHRLHNKTLVVDGWAANVGGRNLADEYFGLHDEHNFRDMEVLAMGSSVAAVSRHFDGFWNSGWSFPIGQLVEVPAGSPGLSDLRAELEASVGAARVASEGELEQLWRNTARQAVAGTAHFLSDQPASEDPALDSEKPSQLADFLFASIAAAKSEVIMVSAYMVPTDELSEAIREGLGRGVRMRILTNSMRSNNHLSAHAAYLGYVYGLVESGVELYELRADAADRNLYMQSPTEGKRLGLHAKFMLLDNDRVFVGSSNLDPRSLKLNTEVGLMIESAELNRLLRDSIEVDFAPRNAWSVQLGSDDKLIWVGDGEIIDHPPADSVFQQLEDWFMGLLPIDSNM